MSCRVFLCAVPRSNCYQRSLGLWSQAISGEHVSRFVVVWPGDTASQRVEEGTFEMTLQRHIWRFLR